MFGYTGYYHGSLRKYIILFGTTFNQIYLQRKNADGYPSTLIRVPITYGPRDKVLARSTLDPNLNRPFASILPYMSFQVKDMLYDEQRHLNAVHRQGFQDPNKDVAQYVYNPVPWNIEFELVIMFKNLEDGAEILEQILPFFTPDFTTTLKIIDDPLIERDIPLIIKDGINYVDTWQGGFTERAYATYTLNFTMKAYFFGPIPRHKIIKFANVQGIVDGEVGADITVSPGLTAEGLPTSDPTQSVPYSDITWTDDYGIITELS